MANILALNGPMIYQPVPSGFGDDIALSETSQPECKVKLQQSCSGD